MRHVVILLTLLIKQEKNNLSKLYRSHTNMMLLLTDIFKKSQIVFIFFDVCVQNGIIFVIFNERNWEHKGV